jgi:hypothetical protein
MLNKNKMSLNYPNSPGKTTNLVDNAVTVRSKLVVPTFETLPVGYNFQMGSVLYVSSTNTLYIGTPSGLVPIQGTTSNLADAPGIAGSSIIYNGVGPNLQIKGLNGGNGVSVASSPSDISIAITGTGYVGGTGIDITSDVVTNTLPGVVYTSGPGISILANVISNTGIVSITAGDSTVQVSGPQSNVLIGLGYQAGANVNIVGNVISSTIPVGVDTVTAGDSTVTIGGTLTNPTIALNYQGGSDISITGINVINCTSPSVVLSVTAGDSTISISGTPTNPVVSGNYQGASGVTIVGNVISATSHVVSISAGDSTIVVGGTATAPVVSSGYVAGSEVSIVGNVISVVPTTVTTLTSPDGTLTINNALPVNTIAGNYIGVGGISITGNVISIPSPHISTLAAGDTTISVGGTSTNPIVSGNYLAGNGIAITGNVISELNPSSATGTQTYNFITNLYYFNGISAATDISANLVHSSLSAGTTLIGSGFVAVFNIVAMIALKITDFKIGFTLDPSLATALMTNASLVKNVYLCVNSVRITQINFTANDFTLGYSLSGLNIYVPQYSSFSVQIGDNDYSISTTNIQYNAISWVKGTRGDTTTAIPAPADVTTLGSPFSTQTTINFEFDTPSDPNFQGLRIIYLPGGTAPTSWTDPTVGCVRLYESSNYCYTDPTTGKMTVTVSGLESAKPYSFRFISINGNTPPTMSTGVASTKSTI